MIFVTCEAKVKRNTESRKLERGEGGVREKDFSQEQRQETHILFCFDNDFYYISNVHKYNNTYSIYKFKYCI